MTTTMTAIATIKHNDREDVRVTLYDGGDGFVWAAAPGEEPYKTDVEVERAAIAWAGDEWDYQPATDPNDIKIEMTGNGLYEHVATHPDGRERVARGNMFECVGADGCLTFDAEHARRYHADQFDAK